MVKLAAILSGYFILMQHIHILGICGTFMGSLAQLAAAKGYRVTGCDANVYPPMSTQLEAAGIALIEGYDLSQLDLNPDLIVIGNAMSRGNPLVEALLDRGLPYTSGPQWLRDNVLKDKWVLAVSGTHGKTTTSSMLAWILDYARMSPGYLIGGVPLNFAVSARLGETPFFVIEADEYDSAFFDKRSKFVHYTPRTLIINNLEFDHGDIFDDLAAIQKQFHHLVRTVPHNGIIIYPSDTPSINEVVSQGCWTPEETISLSSNVSKPTTGWSLELVNEDGSEFTVLFNGVFQATVSWSQLGLHSVANGLAAIAAARHVGVTPEVAAAALTEFKGVKRRMECLYNANNVSVYDDFAHHPTAIKTTIDGLRAKVGSEQIVVLIEPRSNTMRMGLHQSSLAAACTSANNILWYSPRDLDWDINPVIEQTTVPAETHESIEGLIQRTCELALALKGSQAVHVLVMSNGGFAGIHQKLIKQLAN
ncbi:MAG: UDP-N-acetylmuramate: L-alanyl-gamma-D-glutamyl-meso-diaminopimelate ligase [Cellvibrionaceae bacterium]|jgi:UDP-N-acetylmuramate: L-alanyl-gamma-D-glutamyl-meso-diaminopimelate ligase